MAPILTTSSHAYVSLSQRQGTNGTTASLSTSNNNAIYMVGIAIICIAVVVLLGWLGLKHWRARQAAASQKAEAEIVDAYIGGEDVFKSGGMASDSLEKHKASVVEIPIATKPLPPRPARPSLSPLAKPRVRSSSLGVSGRPHSGMKPKSPSAHSRLRISTLPQDNRTSTATMTENELIDYHLNGGTMPVAFAPLILSPPGSPNSARHPSVTIQQASIVTVPRLSPGPKAQRPQSNSSPGHFRLGSFSASIRHSLTSLQVPSPTKSIFNFGVTRKPFRTPSSLPPASPDNQRTIVVTTFSPLLPDELVLKPGVQEKVTVLQTYDDGWCIVARTNLGVLEVGAVPEWVFGLADGEDEMFAMRPMRSTSLGVTVDLRVVDAGPVAGDRGEARFSWALATMTDERASVISWSNF